MPTEIQLFSCLQLLDQGVECLEKDVQNIENALQSPRTSQEYYQLFLDLDRALQPLKQLQQSADSLELYAQDHLSRLAKVQEKAPMLFGNLITFAVDCEVTEIRLEAQSLLQGDLVAVAQKVDALRRHIGNLRHDHCLSQKNIRIIGAVERFVSMVDTFIARYGTKGLSSLPQLTIPDEMDPLTAELLMEIFEIAEEGISPLMKNRKERLPPNVLRRAEEHKAALSLSLGISGDKLESAALLATALEMAQGKRLDDPLEEIGAYYAELNSL